LLAYVSALGQIARLNFERYDVASEVIFKVKGRGRRSLNWEKDQATTDNEAKNCDCISPIPLVIRAPQRLRSTVSIKSA
jgi:hypothetical protein